MQLKDYMNLSDSVDLFASHHQPEAITLLFRLLISASIKETICQESNPEYFDICQEFRKIDYSDATSDYLLVLPKTLESMLLLEIYEFTFLYQSRQADDRVIHKDKKFILRDTLGLLEVMLKALNKNVIVHNQKDDSILNEHLEILSIMKERYSDSSSKYTTFISAIKRAKANYIIRPYTLPHEKFNGVFIYPIIVDLIYNRFYLMLVISRYRNELISSREYSNTVQSLLTKQTPSHDNRFSYLTYIHSLLNKIPLEFDLENQLRDNINWKRNIQEVTTKIILLHYAEVFGVEYSNLQSLLKQCELRSTFSQSRYDLKKSEVNIKLNFESNYFRNLSLFVV